MFVNYWFVCFAFLFFVIFWILPKPLFRKYWLLTACLIFHYKFAGPAGVLPIILMGILVYLAGLSGNKLFRLCTIFLCVLELIFYKYSVFLLGEIVRLFNVDYANRFLEMAKNNILPSAAPLAISFFVFEFVHYLVDVHAGKKPIKSIPNFILFSIFWPSVISGPIKRFEQFLPALVEGCTQVNTLDIQIGVMRIMMGFVKKLVIADNLTAYINARQPDFALLTMETRWFIVAAISLRILFDFSGYSDIAIGFARLMGIRLPENFNWPYLATNLQDFWRRWHISLSSWIRDYIYIPLGGSKNGNIRKIFNGIFAFAICGLWHGAAWNFIFWGVYHGFGLVAATQTTSFTSKSPYLVKHKIFIKPFTWAVTLFYVCIGWLFFFYPVSEALNMLKVLFMI